MYLQQQLCTCLTVPARSLHVQAVHVGALTRRTADVLTALLCDVTLQRHLVQRPLVLPGHLLHDGGEEGLRVEETCEPRNVLCKIGLILLKQNISCLTLARLGHDSITECVTFSMYVLCFELLLFTQKLRNKPDILFHHANKCLQRMNIAMSLPASQTAVGSWKSADQPSSSLIRCWRSVNQPERPRRLG